MSGDPEHIESRCSWCLAIAGHERTEKNGKLRRSVYRCTACGKSTLPCKRCLPSGAEGAVGAAAPREVTSLLRREQAGRRNRRR